jgi:2,5-dihydroxypyridine 5,6-dioxygenase
MLRGDFVGGLPMFVDRVEERWISAFLRTFELCAIEADMPVAILGETQSRALNVQLAELALARLGAKPFHLTATTPPQTAPVPVRSTGACQALRGHPGILAALKSVPVIVDVTVEGLMHAPELPEILASGARVLTVSNEHPEALERLVPEPWLKDYVQAAARLMRHSRTMTVTSAAGTDLRVDMEGASTVGIWGYTTKPGTLAHWPGGIVVSFPRAGATNGLLVLDEGDINLTFKRYLEQPVSLTIEEDFVRDIAGGGTDAELMRRYWAAWDDINAYAVSHVGFGMNPGARYEALTLYDKGDINGTELRAYAGNFLFSTGANEFAERYTEGHFDLPMRGCTIALDGQNVVTDGVINWEALK